MVSFVSRKQPLLLLLVLGCMVKVASCEPVDAVAVPEPIVPVEVVRLWNEFDNDSFSNPEERMYDILADATRDIYGQDLLDQSPTVLENVSVTDYMGRWFEAASSLSARKSFELGCSCTEANYTLVNDSFADGYFNVKNECLKNGLFKSQFFSKAWAVSDFNNNVDPADWVVDSAKFQLSELEPNPGFPGNYWIIYANVDFDVVVVAGASAWLSPLFVLSRERLIDESEFDAAIAGAVAAGIPPLRLVSPLLLRTEQVGCSG